MRQLYEIEINRKKSHIVKTYSINDNLLLYLVCVCPVSACRHDCFWVQFPVGDYLISIFFALLFRQT